MLEGLRRDAPKGRHFEVKQRRSVLAAVADKSDFGCRPQRSRYTTTVLIVLALRATPGSADIGIGSMDVYRPNIDPVALVAIAAVTAVVGVAAAFVPARRAVRMDPLMALRHE